MSETKMKLTKEEQSILKGSQGDTMAKIMKTLVMYGETFGADSMVEVTGEAGHLVTSFGLSIMKPVYELMDQLIEDGIKSKKAFTVDPRPMDIKNLPSNFIQKIVFRVMYGKQDDYEEQLKKLGLISEDGFTCTCYMDEVGNIPQKGDVISWAESSAVVYANSVLGARCNRNSGIIELFGNILGKVPNFGLLTDEGRKATWVVDIITEKIPEAQILGSAIGLKVMEDVPYIRGLNKFLGDELNQAAKDYLKDMGAATASNGAVGLYHVDKLTPEAVELGDDLIVENPKIYVIDDAELEKIKNSYPVIWDKPDAKPKLCFVGCPHLSYQQLQNWTKEICDGLKKSGRSKVIIPTVLTTSPDVLKKFKKSEAAEKLKETGVVVSYICPLMFMNNPMWSGKPVITNSNKLRTYTSCRYHTDFEILNAITERTVN